VNFAAGQTVANAVIAPVSAAGEVCLFTNVPTHLLADVNGWFASGDEFMSMSPERLFDTRPGVDAGTGVVPKGRMPAGSVLRVVVGGTGSVPSSGFSAVSLNVTVVDPTSAGFVTVYPCGVLPLASNVNFAAGQTVANAVIAPVSAAGEVCLFTNVPTHLLADVNGWFASGML
jgi:hypothetical protein